MTTTTDISPDTTIYIIGAGDEPHWYAATDSPEEAVAQAIAGIGLTTDPDKATTPGPLRVSKISAGEFAEYEDTLNGVRHAQKDATELRTYDHEKALQLAEEVDGQKTDNRIQDLDDKIAAL